MRKILLRFVAFPLVLLAGVIFSHLLHLYVHPECTLRDFSYSYPFEPYEHFSISSEEKMKIDEILNQKFFYLGNGKQMTAYLSQDGKYVLKFYNPRSFVKREWFASWKKLKQMITLKFFADAYFNRKERIARLARRNKLAFLELKEETGTIYAHFNDSTQLDKIIQIQEKNGSYSSINILRYPFVLQKKVNIASEYLSFLVRGGDFEQAKQVVYSLANLFINRSKKGYTDRIQTLHNNYGFIDGEAVQIDVGRIVKIADQQISEVASLKTIFNSLKRSIYEINHDLGLEVEDTLDFKLQQYYCDIDSIK
ncbi:MAG: hypothetical protein FJZ57_04915 [Chlamydiae bacterium]|nr:hypothetical protein [Chlamydiota bacterium]